MVGNKPDTHRDAQVVKGNKTTLDRGSKQESMYASSTLTNYSKEPGKPPAVPDSDVAYARRFVEENKK